MPPKKEIKNKKSKAAQEKTYDLLTQDEMKAREQKYTNLIAEVTKCFRFIEDALVEITKLDEEQLLKNKWLDFVSCNPLPKAYLPPDIRLFFCKLMHRQCESEESNISWLLRVDERSILTQNIFRQDLTKCKVKEEARAKENISLEYNRYINDSLTLLKRIEDFLDNDLEVAKCPVNILSDIVDRKAAIKNEIIDFIDRFTYRIITSENSEMISIDAISSEYFYNAENFDIHIWCLKNVALRIPYLSEPRLVPYFHSIKLHLHVPAKMLRENLVIRALHTKFDHLSESAKSFKQTITLSTNHVNAGIVDLYECLLNEWIMQLEIQERIRAGMMEKRLEYEERMREYLDYVESEKKQKKSDKDQKKKQKVVKMPTKEPPIVTADMFPDVHEEFLVEEEKQYQEFIHLIYKPELLGLTPDEINLKKYFILGGVYQLYYVEKPEHFDFNSFNMTWHKNERNLVLDKEVIIKSSITTHEARKPLVRRETLKEKRLTRLMEMYDDARMKEMLVEDPECPWFIITIELPEYLCYWGEPIACHYESDIETETKFKVEEPRVSEPQKKTKKKSEQEQSETEPESKTQITTTASSMDKSVADLLKSFSRTTAIRSFLFQSKPKSFISKTSARPSFFSESLATMLLLKRKMEENSKDSLCIQDFALGTILTKPQIRHMERHIIPRIISSYKFPKEINLEEIEASNTKAKGKGGRILRQKTENEPPQTSNKQFTFSAKQNNPERIFAIYPKVEPLNVITHLTEDNIENEHDTYVPSDPETFGQLLQDISNVKKKYRLEVRKTIDLKPFETSMKTHNKRIKQMQFQRDLAAIESRISDDPILTDIKAIKSLKSVKSFKTLVHAEAQKVAAEKAKDPKDDKEFDIEDNLLIEEASSEMLTEKVPEKSTDTYAHWTTKYILKSEYDREKRKIVLYTNRLGNFGFAFKRYEQFPFRNWSMEPSAENPDNEVLFTLDTQYVGCILYITANGIRGHVTEISDTYLRNPKMYLVIKDPIKDYKEFKDLFRQHNLNIFAEHDACFYIENGYISQKHLSNEIHTYCCMAVHSTQMRFNCSKWNRLAKRRDIVLHFRHYKDLPENLVQVRITPGLASFVDVEELCSEDLDVIKLQFNLTWRNIEPNCDLHGLIVSMYPAATDSRCQNPRLLCFIKDLLSEIRPLSFS